MTNETAQQRVREVRKTLRARLPPEAFAADPWKSLRIAGHVAVACAAFLGLRMADSAWVMTALALVIGHAYFCLGELNHQLSHKTIVDGRIPTYPLEVLAWGFVATPATWWRNNHMKVHHNYTNMMNDSFRYFVEEEATPTRRMIAVLFYPSKSLRWNPLPLLQYFVLMFTHVASAFTSGGRPDAPMVTHLGVYTAMDRLRMVGEYVVVVGIQVLVYFAVGADLTRYMFAGPVAFLVAGAITSAYAFTQHSLHPLAEYNDPLENTTSLRMPALVDALHSNVSYHVEHHLFSSMNSDYYPHLAKILRAEFPDRYHSIGFFEAWRLMQDNPALKKRPVATEPSPARAAEPESVVVDRVASAQGAAAQA